MLDNLMEKMMTSDNAFYGAIVPMIIITTALSSTSIIIMLIVQIASR